MDLISNFAIYIIFVAFVNDNGKLLSATENIDITTCDGSTKAGSVIFVKYTEMKSHCECKINSHFIGVLRFTSNRITFACYTEINTFENDKPDRVLRLPCGYKRTSGGFNVTSDSVLFMTSNYVNFTTGSFYQEVTIYEEKFYNGTISITCGGSFSKSMTTTIRKRATNDIKLNVTGKPNVSSETLTDDIQNKDNKSGSPTKCSPMNYMIPGASGAIIGALLTVIISVVICHLRQRKSVPKTTGMKDDTHSGQQNNGAYDELPDNPPYQSYKPVDNEPHLYDPLQQV